MLIIHYLLPPFSIISPVIHFPKISHLLFQILLIQTKHIMQSLTFKSFLLGKEHLSLNKDWCTLIQDPYNSLRTFPQGHVHFYLNGDTYAKILYPLRSLRLSETIKHLSSFVYFPTGTRASSPPTGTRARKSSKILNTSK